MSAYDAAASLLREHAGFRFDTAMSRRLSRSLQTGSAARGESVEGYVAAASRDPDALQDLLDRVAVEETSFFRDGPQLDAFAGRLLDALDEPVRIWCAGCSTGQEAYSIAMLLAESGVRNWELVATDVSSLALERTAAASYGERELRGLMGWRRDRWLHPESEGFVVDDSLRERIRVLRHNLVRDDPPFPPGWCAVVFCRNVLIYLAHREQGRLLERLHRWLPEGGQLLVGASESLSHLETRLAPVDIGGGYAYVKQAGPAAPPAPPAVPPPVRPQVPAEPLPAVETLIASGDAAAAQGRFEAAVTAYRQASYVAPGAPLPYALMGLALEHAGDRDGARRAFRAAWSAFERAEGEQLEEVEGYRPEELARLLIEKLGAPA